MAGKPAASCRSDPDPRCGGRTWLEGDARVAHIGRWQRSFISLHDRSGRRRFGMGSRSCQCRIPHRVPPRARGGDRRPRDHHDQCCPDIQARRRGDRDSFGKHLRRQHGIGLPEAEAAVKDQEAASAADPSKIYPCQTANGRSRPLRAAERTAPGFMATRVRPAVSVRTEQPRRRTLRSTPHPRANAPDLSPRSRWGAFCCQTYYPVATPEPILE